MELKYRSKNRNIAENFPKYLKVKQHTSKWNKDQRRSYKTNEKAFWTKWAQLKDKGNAMEKRQSF